MTLSNRQRRQFRAIGHHLKPIVTVASKGMTDAVTNELSRAIRDHELIKIKLNVGEREQRQQVLDNINERLESVTIQAIGNVAVIYKAAKRPDPLLSNVLRSGILG